jgi:hypothetical protein
VLLVISDFFITKVIAMLWPAFDYVVSKCKKAPFTKREFKVSLQTIGLIYSQSLIWITFAYFPYVAILAPVFLFLDFKFQVWRLNQFSQSRPLRTQASDIAMFIMKIYNITFALAIAYYFVFLRVDMHHQTYGSNADQCGPYDTHEHAWQPVDNFFYGNTALEIIWTSIINFSPLLWCLVLCFATLNSFNNNRKKIIGEYLEAKETETRNQIFDLQRGNARLRKQLALNKKVADSNALEGKLRAAVGLTLSPDLFVNDQPF